MGYWQPTTHGLKGLDGQVLAVLGGVHLQVGLVGLAVDFLGVLSGGRVQFGHEVIDDIVLGLILLGLQQGVPDGVGQAWGSFAVGSMRKGLGHCLQLKL